MKKYIVLFLTILALVLFVAFDQIYWTGYENGVHRTEQCHAQYGVMKADYEEHFICIY